MRSIGRRGLARRRWTGRASWAWLAALALSAAAGTAWAQEAEPRDADPSRLKGLSLEELLDVEVTSVSKRSEHLSRAAAAVSVITGEDLRRAGVTHLAEALRLADGLHVGRFDSRTWAISARGFNNNAANKMQVMIDGRSVYTPLFSGVFWDVQDTFLADIDRIEVIRGPGATLWGANAVNGVINILTKPAAETQGGLATGVAGDEVRALGSARWGGRLGRGDGEERGFYRAFAKYSSLDPLAFADGTSARDPLRQARGGFRSDWRRSERDGFTIQGDLYKGVIGSAIRDDTDIEGGNVLGRWERQGTGGSQLQVQAYVDRTVRRVPAQFGEERDTFDLEVQQRLLRGRHDLLLGAGYRVSADDVTNTAVIGWQPEDRTLDLWSAFVQDEVAWSDTLRLIVGTKLEVNDFAGLEVQPSVRFAWTPDARRTLWGAVSRAVRSPTRIDTDLRVPGNGPVVLQGNEDFESEVLIAWELGYRTTLGPALTADLALFHNEYDRLRSQELPPPGQPGPIVLGNRLNATVNGAELALRFETAPWWRWHASYTRLDKDVDLDAGSRDLTGGRSEGNDPKQQGFLRTSLDLPRDIEVDAWLRWVDELPFPHVPATTQLDLRLGWWATPRLELSVAGQNLLDDRHVQFRSGGAAVEEVERSVFGRVTCRF